MPSPLSSPPPRSRRVESVVRGIATADGAGVRLTRVLTRDLQRRLDPFLMLDVFRNDDPDDYSGGFPDHPHRGFETITHMLAGCMRHRDSAGNDGRLGPGGAQWMTAGCGLVHSEMPEQQDGLLEGFQLWLNLPAADKLCPPSYRDIPAAQIPEFVTADGVRVRVLAGASHGLAGAVQRPRTEPLYLDVHLPDGAVLAQPIPTDFNAFAYVYRGRAAIGGCPVDATQMAVLANDGGDGARLSGHGEARLILVAGRPLGEPIAQWGPFVMNSTEEIHQAVADYRNGRFDGAAVRSLNRD